MKKIILLRIVAFLLLALTFFCIYTFLREYRVMEEEVSGYSELRNTYTSTTITATDTSIRKYSDFTDEPAVRELPRIDIDFDALLEINPDTVGWIMIPDTVLSYPVVQATNNNKYLSISFEGSQSRAGTPFADRDNDLQVFDSNTIIYGHNMGAGRTDMFSTLLLYKDYDHFIANRYIWFDTVHRQHGWWEVFAVIELDVRDTDFHYQQIRFQYDDDFVDWIEIANSLSMHSADIEITEYDHILTLSTCDRGRYGRNGRVLILAVRVSDFE